MGVCSDSFGPGTNAWRHPWGYLILYPVSDTKGFPDMPPTTARQARRQSRVAAALLLLSFLLLLAMVVLTSIGAPA